MFNLENLKIVKCKLDKSLDKYINDIFNFYTSKEFVEKMPLVQILNLDTFDKFREKIVAWHVESFENVYFIVNTQKENECVGMILFNIHKHDHKLLNVGFALNPDYWRASVVDTFLPDLEKKVLKSKEYRNCSHYLISCVKSNKGTKRIAIDNKYIRSPDNDCHPRMPNGELHLDIFLQAYIKEIKWK